VIELIAALALARVQVTAMDFEYRLSRTSVPAGQVAIELVNFGEDEHDLALRRVGGTRTFRIRSVLPGERARLSLRLSPGRYRLWCEVGDHAEHGMTATLRVTRPARRG
jgi:hypothetical protein